MITLATRNVVAGLPSNQAISVNTGAARDTQMITLATVRKRHDFTILTRLAGWR